MSNQYVTIGDITYVLSDEDIMPFGGLPLLDYLNIHPDLAQLVNTVPYYQPVRKREPSISNADTIKTMVELLSLGKTSYADVNSVNGSSFFKDTLHIRRLHSEESLHQ